MWPALFNLYKSLKINEKRKKYMVPRRFTTKIEQCHRKWLGEALDLPLTGHNGIDYCNDFFAIELKSKLKAKGYSINFAVNHDQEKYFPKQNPKRDLYWAFMSYTFSKSVLEVKEKDKLEELVLAREVWCLPWEWISKFPVYSPTKSGHFRYIPIKQIANKEEMTSFSVKKGNIHVQTDSSLEQKLINKMLSSSQEQKEGVF